MADAARELDFIVIGAGIAGASAAFELARHGRVALLERESQPGYHTTGRSAAMFIETYGPPIVRRLATASGGFFFSPPEGFSETPLLSPRGAMFIARVDQRQVFEEELAATRRSSPTALDIDGARACEIVPVLQPGYVAAAIHEPEARGIDVHALHHGFLRGLRATDGALVTDAEVKEMRRADGIWRVETPAGVFAAPVVVNASGAWADEVGAMAGVAPIGLTPCRRTAFTFEPPAGVDPESWPLTIDIEEQFYFKPEAGLILGSPADETPMPPCDVQPEEIDVAVAVDRIERATTLEIRRLTHRWAGLRSFVEDHVPVVGFDPKVEGLFWLAGQGGVGIMTSPAMARITAALARGEDLPDDIRRLGVTAEALGPERLGR